MLEQRLITHELLLQFTNFLRSIKYELRSDHTATGYNITILHQQFCLHRLAGFRTSGQCGASPGSGRTQKFRLHCCRLAVYTGIPARPRGLFRLPIHLQLGGGIVEKCGSRGTSRLWPFLSEVVLKCLLDSSRPIYASIVHVFMVAGTLEVRMMCQS